MPKRHRVDPIMGPILKARKGAPRATERLWLYRVGDLSGANKILQN